MATGSISGRMAGSGFLAELVEIGAPITAADGPGFLYAAGHGFRMNHGVGVYTTTADGTGMLDLAGIGFPQDIGDLPG